MGTRVADRLDVVRRRTFVGRAADLEFFAHALAQDDLPFLLLHVSGPGGVGKSSLLRRFEQIAAEAGVRCWLVDARTLPAGPAAVAAALVPDDEPDGRGVLLVDTYELLRPLDDWIRTGVLPRLSADTLVVIAGQDPPTPAWRTDDGWGPLMRHLPLRNLTPSESTAYLSARAVPPSLHADAVKFTHGHPLALALALVGEVLERTGSFDPRGSPDVLGVLLERLLTAAPSPLHAQALEAAAQVRVLTEPLLAAMIPEADARAVFAWARGRPSAPIPTSRRCRLRTSSSAARVTRCSGTTGGQCRRRHWSRCSLSARSPPRRSTSPRRGATSRCWCSASRTSPKRCAPCCAT